MCYTIDEQTAVVLNAALLLLVARQGTESEMRLALKGDSVSMTYLAGKYGDERRLAATAEALKQMPLPPS